MNRIALIFVAGLLAAGCTSSRSDSFIQYEVPPAPGTCTYGAGQASGSSISPVKAVLLPRLEIPVLGKLSLTLGFQVQNNVSPSLQTNPAGDSINNKNSSDAIIQAADISLADLSGNQIASETVLASGYIQNSNFGTVLVDIMGKPLADALRSQLLYPKHDTSTQQLLLNIVFKGQLVSGGSVKTEPFQYELDVDGTDPWLVTQSGGDSETIAFLSDGGLAAEAIHADGSHDLEPDGGAFIAAAVDRYESAGSDGGAPNLFVDQCQ